MKELLINIDKKNKWLILTSGLLFFGLYTVCLYFRPHESWCDDAYWADWARQLAVHGRYYTTVWGSGHPSYCPLYVFIMAVWYKMVGFSFFAAQFPNICFTLITYWLLMLILAGKKYIASWQSIIGFSLLYWFAPTMFWIYNCGRIEVLCLLLGVLTAYSFVRSLETNALKHKIELFVFSILLFATGIEGVVFATLFIFIYSIYYFREVWNSKKLYIWHLGGYVTSLGILGIITWKADCLLQFLGTMFGASKTITPLCVAIWKQINYALYGKIVEVKIQSAPVSKASLFQSLIDGFSLNYEYLMLLVIVVSLFVCLLYSQIERSMKKTASVMVTMAMISPLVYVLLGRYVSYYTWAAYIPCILALVLLMEQLYIKWAHIGVGWLMIVWFFICPTNKMLHSLDFSKQKDQQNITDIQRANINPTISTVIPYSWYYYIVENNENIWFQASGAYPDDLSVIIYAPDEYNEKKFMSRYELQERCRIGNKIVYDIVSKKEAEKH